MSRNKPETSWKAELERVHEVKQEVFDRIRRVEQKMAAGGLDEVLQKMKAFNDRFVIVEKATEEHKYEIKSHTQELQTLAQEIKHLARRMERIEGQLENNSLTTRIVQTLEKEVMELKTLQHGFLKTLVADKKQDKKVNPKVDPEPEDLLHPWQARWNFWYEYRCPANGHSESFPLADITMIINKPKCLASIIMLHAKNDAHISMSHFLFVVGGLEEGHKIWLQASQCAIKEGTTMQLWTSDCGDNRVMFCIAPEQFAEGISVKEGIDGWFNGKIMARKMIQTSNCSQEQTA
jgi:archaellum component FlaC